VGVNLRELIPDNIVTKLDLEVMKYKIIALDAYNMLYQFLSAIRQPDGTPLMDSQGRITSHLSGLFYRTINLLEHGIKVVYVFDGKPPELKQRELEKRQAIREEAERKYKEALQKGDIELARRYAQAASRLTTEMVEESKKLLEALGIPYVDAPAEGEAQAAYIVQKGDAWATASQDYDSLLFGSPRLVRNIAITGKRKLPRKDVYIEIKPELIELDKLTSTLGISRDQLIVIGILVGTDYNPDGVKGIGPKTALRIIKSTDKPLDLLQKYSTPNQDLVKIYEYFKNPPVTDNYKLEWREPIDSKIKEILVEEHDFSLKRVENAIERLHKAYREHIRGRQVGLDLWFKKK